MKIIVTGGSGFIGTKLIELLLDIEGVEVVNFDIKISESFPELTIVGDVRDYNALNEVCLGADVIYNLAAEHADNVTPLSLYNDVNVGGAKNIVKAATENNVKKIIFTSTVAVYGLNRGMPNEQMDAKPFNEYGRSKHLAEQFFDKWLAESNERTLVTIRPAVVFGERNRGNVYNLIKQIVSGRFLMVGSGMNCKSMGYVGNVAEFLKQQLSKGSGYFVYNYADKPDLTSSQIVDIVKTEMGITRGNIKVPYSVGLWGGYVFDVLSKVTGKKFPVSSVRIKKFCADTTIDSTAAMSSGFKPSFTLEEGLKRMIQHEFK